MLKKWHVQELVKLTGRFTNRQGPYFDHIHPCIGKEALYIQQSRWAELDGYRECVRLQPKVILTPPDPITNPINIARLHSLSSPLIDFNGASSSEALEIRVTKLAESLQLVTLLHLEQTSFSTNEFLYRKAVTKDPKIFGAQSLHSQGRVGLVVTSAQKKKRRLKSCHFIPSRTSRTSTLSKIPGRMSLILSWLEWMRRWEKFATQWRTFPRFTTATPDIWIRRTTGPFEKLLQKMWPLYSLTLHTTWMGRVGDY